MQVNTYPSNYESYGSYYRTVINFDYGDLIFTTDPSKDNTVFAKLTPRFDSSIAFNTTRLVELSSFELYRVYGL